MAAPTESLAQLVLRCTGSPLLGLVAELQKRFEPAGPAPQTENTMPIIYKYPLGIIDEQYLDIPDLADVLAVKVQEGQLTLWVRIDSNRGHSKGVDIYIVPTGHPFDDHGQMYLTTFQSGHFVGHVFYTLNTNGEH